MVNDLLQRSSATIAQQGPVRQLSRSQKAAAVLLAVGPETAAKVLRHLSDSEVEQVALEIATLGQIAPEQMQSVLNEFVEEAVAHSHLINGGEQQAREVLRRLRGREGDEIVDRLLATVHVTPFAFLRQHEPNEVIVHLRDEHPQTIALILAHLKPTQAAELLNSLPEDLRVDVITRMANLEEISPDVITRISQVIEQRLKSLGGSAHEAYGGVRAVAELLNRIDRSVSQTVLEAVESQSPDLAVAIRNLMFVFDDLLHVDDAALREIIQRADKKALTIALKGTSEEIRNRFFSNMSKRAADMVREEIELLGAIRLRDVEKNQQEIVAIARKLEEEGLLVTGAAAGESYVV